MSAETIANITLLAATIAAGLIPVIFIAMIIACDVQRWWKKRNKSGNKDN